MSLIKMAERLNAANQITTWNNQCMLAMQQAKSAYTSISNQRTAMADNPDYTSEEVAEIDTMLTDLNAMAVSLTI